MKVKYTVPNCWSCDRGFTLWSDQQRHVSNCLRPERHEMWGDISDRAPSRGLDKMMRQRPHVVGPDRDE